MVWIIDRFAFMYFLEFRVNFQNKGIRTERINYGRVYVKSIKRLVWHSAMCKYSVCPCLSVFVFCDCHCLRLLCSVSAPPKCVNLYFVAPLRYDMRFVCLDATPTYIAARRCQCLYAFMSDTAYKWHRGCSRSTHFNVSSRIHSTLKLFGTLIGMSKILIRQSKPCIH